jgi:hypothetical protein
MCNEGKKEDSEEKKRKKKTVRMGEANNNPLKGQTANACKCGGNDHKRISSSRCPWRGFCRWKWPKIMRKE